MGTMEKSFVEMRLREYAEDEHYLEVSYLRHMYERHINLTDDDLRVRLRRDHMKMASRFTMSMGALRQVIRMTLCQKDNLNYLRRALYESKGEVNPPLISVVSPVLYRTGKDGVKKEVVTGKCVYRRNPGEVCELRHLVVVITAIPGVGLTGGLPRFKIVNAFPCEADTEPERR